MADLVFQKLTPTNDVDLNGYEEGFKFVFDNKDIRNIAISGPYSSGKSSVLQTYEKKHKEMQFMHIFLAHFSNVEESNLIEDEQPEKIESGNADKKANVRNSLENTIEGKIINQLVQQIPAEDIQHTHFHVKHEVEKNKYLYITLGVGLILIAILLLLHGKEWAAWVSTIRLFKIREAFNITRTHMFQFLLGASALGVFLYGLYKILLTQANKNVLKKLSIQGNEIEIFSDTTDTYFDRYLNEVLYLLDQVKADAIVFEDIDRFNEIQIFERLREINTLANIRREHLGKSEIKFFYLLRDDIFTTKDRTKFFDYIMPVIPVVDGSNSYNKLKEYLVKAGFYEELDDFFLRDLCLYIDDLRLVKNIVNEFVLFEHKLNRIELDYNKLLALITYKNIFPKDYADLQLRKGFVFEVFDQKEKYAKRKAKENGKEEHDIECYTIAQIIDGNSESEVFKVYGESELGKKTSFEDVKGNDYFALLKFLLSDGYIDETYKDYLTFFYDNTLTTNDKVFLRSISDRKGKEYSYHLNDVKLVLENIKPSRFRQEETLNYDLIEYLLKEDKDREYLSPVVILLQESHNFDFVVSFFNTGRETKKFVMLLNELWPEFFSVICTQGDDRLIGIQREFSKITLMACDKETLQLVNKNGDLSGYVSAQSDYLKEKLDKKSVEPLIASMRTVGVKFEKIDANESDERLLEGVYNRNLYIINLNNLRMFMQRKYQESDMAIDFSRSATIIYSKINEPLYGYLSQNPELALLAILDITKEVYHDDEEIVLLIINSEEIAKDVREKYLLRCATEISRLEDIHEKNFYNILIEKSLLVLSVDNIFSYYKAMGWTKKLDDFINTEAETLNYKTGNTVILDANQKKRFVQDAIKSNNISEVRLCEIVQQLYEINNNTTFNTTGCLLRNVKVLAQEKKIAVSRQNLEFVRNNYQEAIRAFITSDIKSYINVFSSTYIKSEVEMIFGWIEVSDDDKLSLLKKKSGTYTALCSDYPEQVLVEILKNHCNESELPELYKQYEKYTPLVRDEIFNIAKRKFTANAPFKGDLSFNLLIRLLALKDISLTKRIELAKKYIRLQNVDNRNEIIASIGGGDIVYAMKPRTRKAVSYTADNELILQMLKNEKIIDDYEKIKEGDKLRIIMSKRKKK